MAGKTEEDHQKHSRNISQAPTNIQVYRITAMPACLAAVSYKNPLQSLICKVVITFSHLLMGITNKALIKK